jgi:hypothetical protein
MALNIKEGTRATIWEVTDNGTWASVKISSSRKDKRLPEGSQWVNTNWFARFVGKAYEKVVDLPEKTRIELLNAYVAQESYEKDGAKVWPKSAQLVVFDFNVYEGESSATPARSKGYDSTPAVSDEDIPF